MTVEIVVREYSKWKSTHSVYRITVRRASAPVACEAGHLTPPHYHPSSELPKPYTRCSPLSRSGQEDGNSFTSQLQSGPIAMISTWQGQCSDILTTHHPKHKLQKLYCWQALLRRWNLLGCIHPREAELYLSYGRWDAKGPNQLEPQLACRTEMSTIEGKSKRIRDHSYIPHQVPSRSSCITLVIGGFCPQLSDSRAANLSQVRRSHKGKELCSSTWSDYFLVTWQVKNLAANAGDASRHGIRYLSWEDPLEKEMAACSSILAWKIP